MADASITWTKSIASLPKFSFIQIEKHLEGCGKKDIGKKGYKFFIEGYIQDVYVGLNQGDQVASRVNGRCHRSQRKNEAPHSMKIRVADNGGTATIFHAQCSCKGGEQSSPS